MHGRFRIDQRLYEGPRSILYRGHSLQDDEPIAITFPKPREGEAHDRFIRRFRREAREHHKLSLRNPHFVRVIASGTAMTGEGSLLRPFTVLEWLEGQTLIGDMAARCARGQKGRSLDEVMRLFEPVAEAIACAHQHGIVYRKLTAHDFFAVRAEGTILGQRLKVLSFGEAPAEDAQRDSGDGVGSAGPPSDVYCLAVIFLEMLRDRPVIVENGDPSRTVPAPSALGIEVSARVAAVLSQATASRPEDRPQHAGEFWGMLKSAISGDRDSLQRVSKLPLTVPSPVERNTLPEDLRVTLSGAEPATVPRVDPDVILLASADISFVEVAKSGEALEADPPTEDTLVMPPDELKALEFVSIERAPFFPEVPDGPKRAEFELPEVFASPLAPPPPEEPNTTGIAIAVAFGSLVALLCSAFCAALYFEWL
jgi:serine/threonine protein kinase